MRLHSAADFQTACANLRAPPLLFRRRPPQSNYPPGTVPGPDHGPRLELQHDQGGISTTAPPKLAPRLHSLPPILHRPCQNSIPRYSKGSRGLSVLTRVASIFTGATVSPGLSRRQRPSRYAIRAGRNLPDKEFRYLRTVHSVAAHLAVRARSFLSRSACRHAVRTISSRSVERVRRMVSDDS